MIATPIIDSDRFITKEPELDKSAPEVVENSFNAFNNESEDRAKRMLDASVTRTLTVITMAKARITGRLKKLFR